METLIERGGLFTLEVFPRGTRGLRDSETERAMDVWGEIDRWLEAEGLMES